MIAVCLLNHSLNMNNFTFNKFIYYLNGMYGNQLGKLSLNFHLNNKQKVHIQI